MRRAVLGSTRKFWPRLFFGWMPCSVEERVDRRRRQHRHRRNATGCERSDADVARTDQRACRPRSGPVQDVVAQPHGSQPSVVVDALAHDDLLLTGGEPALRCELGAAEARARCRR